jgi:hypothetical protein
MTEEIQTQETQQTQIEQRTQTEKVTFNEAQQAKVNELIREAMGRAGNQARAEAATLKADLEKLRAEHEKIKGEATTTKEKALETGKESLLLSLAGKHNFVRGEQLVKLLGDRVSFDESAKRYVCKNPDGTTMTAANGEPLPVEALVSAYASENPNLVRGDLKLGTGAVESRQWTGEPNQTDRLKQLFGKGSNSRLANELAMRDPQAYRQLKRDAQRAGLIR